MLHGDLGVVRDLIEAGLNEHDVIAGAMATYNVAAMFGRLVGWLSPDRMKKRAHDRHRAQGI